MKIATTTGDFCKYTYDIFKIMEYQKECGFKYLDISFGEAYLVNSPLLTDDYKQYLDKVKDFANKLGIKFVQSHAPMGKPITKDEKHDRYMFMLRRSIECCAYLGIDKIVVHSGHEMGVLKKENFEKNKEFYLSILDFAQNLGVKILTENFNKMTLPDKWYWTDNPCDIVQLLELINHPNLAVCYDIGHANLIDIAQHEQLATLGKRVEALHVQDNNGQLDYHVAPFFGTTNFDSVMYGLKEIGYNGYFTLESTNFYTGDYFKKKFDKDDRLFGLPIELKIQGQKLLYQLAKHMLVSYDCFEE